ncbi:MAG: isoprenylcysteine carboxylmethyltransferase family protein [Candidatus Nanopelagicaceae bacterium]|nr:isoprenylcysteine carboxylmethyltransferase family protein [Candidatus Nanopelagicaceae bacterium]
MSGDAMGESKNLNRWPSRIFVLVQGIILGLLLFTHINFGGSIRRFFWLGTTFEWIGIIGILVAALSLRRSLTAMPIPKADGKMTRQGLYRYVRHPMYSSVLLFSLGIALYYGSLYKYLLVGALLVFFYFKSSYEENFLMEKYPDYSNYAKVTPRFLPRLKRKVPL